MRYRFGWRGASALLRRFRRMLGSLFAGAAALSLSGCMEIETVVRISPDGSGTITERMVMSDEIIDMMKGMAPEGQPMPLYNEGELQAAASGYGPGVVFRSVQGVETDFGKGYVVTYAFADVNEIRVGQDPEDKMPGGGAMESQPEEDGGGFTTFTMEPGSPASLTIHWPVDEGGADSGSAIETTAEEKTETAQSPEEQEAAMEMMRMAFKDMRMAMHVEVDGQIVDSNATHLNGNRVTLIEIAFADFLDSEEAMKSMASSEEPTVADMKEMMRLIPGLKMEIEPEVSVLFD